MPHIPASNSSASARTRRAPSRTVPPAASSTRKNLHGPNYIPTLRQAGNQESFEPPKPAPEELEDPFLKSLQALQRNLESQKTEIADDLAQVVRSPEWKAYDREVETEIARLEDAWMRSPKPVTKETVAELQSAVSTKVEELTAKYQDKMDERDARARSFPQLLDEELKRNWEKLMKELGPPPKPLAPLSPEDFERAFAGRDHTVPAVNSSSEAPALNQDIINHRPASLEGGTTNAEALATLKELLRPKIAKMDSTGNKP